MAAAFRKPSCLAGRGQTDDLYLALVEGFDDTTNAQAEIRALERLGLQGTFWADDCFKQLIAQLRLGLPIPLGWWHRDTSQPPVGAATEGWWWDGTHARARW